MSYKALYRKYRPRNFDDVVGQEPIIKTLNNAINQNKIAHAYLFCGPRGTGKTSVAKIFAMAVNCTGEYKPCMECDSCKSFLEGDSPDVIEIDAASNNGVEEVRDLIDKVKYAPQVSKYKVYIIDEVHMMSVSAFNALLKTIEEPPKHVIFILATTDPHKVIPTIISRCQRYDFNSVSLDTMSQRLIDIMNQEKIEYEDGVVKRIALLSDGGMRDALSILDQVVAYAGNHIELNDIDTVYGSLNNRDLCNYIEFIINNQTIELFDFLSEIQNKGVDIKRVTQDLVNTIKNILFYSYSSDEMNIQFMDKEQVDRILNQCGSSKLIEFSEYLIDANEKMKTSSDVQTYFELISLKLLQHSTSIVSRETIEDTKTNQVNVSRETLKDNKGPETAQTIVSKVKIEEATEESSNDIQEEVFEEDIYVNDMAIQDEPVVEEETIEESNLLDIEEKTVDKEFLLQLLISANKDFKAEVSKQYDRIMDYANEFQWAKQSNVLRNIEIVAAGKNYMIVKTSNKIHAELIEDKKNEQSFQLFMKELFGDYKHVYALSGNEVNELINSFISRRTDGTLPISIELDDIEIDDTEKVIDETTQKAMELFGEDNFIMEE